MYNFILLYIFMYLDSIFYYDVLLFITTINNIWWIVLTLSYKTRNGIKLKDFSPIYFKIGGNLFVNSVFAQYFVDFWATQSLWIFLLKAGMAFYIYEKTVKTIVKLDFPMHIAHFLALNSHSFIEQINKTWTIFNRT